MARGTSLTETEKYAIRAMVEDGLSITKIANKIVRSETVVRKYIDEHLSHVKELVSKVPEDVEKAVYNKLIEAGMEKMDAVSAINVVKGKLTETANIDQVDSIVAWCLKKVNIRSMFVTKTEGGRKGVAVMQPGTSGKLDELRQNRSVRNVDDHIFKQEHSVPKGLNDE